MYGCAKATDVLFRLDSAPVLPPGYDAEIRIKENHSIEASLPKPMNHSVDLGVGGACVPMWIVPHTTGD